MRVLMLQCHDTNENMYPRSTNILEETNLCWWLTAFSNFQIICALSNWFQRAQDGSIRCRERERRPAVVPLGFYLSFIYCSPISFFLSFSSFKVFWKITRTHVKTSGRKLRERNKMFQTYVVGFTQFWFTYTFVYFAKQFATVGVRRSLLQKVR